MARNGSRIGEEELARLKAGVSLEAVVKAAGVELSRRGHDLVGCCPFHEDKTPSFVVTPEKQLWRCFGACDAGGDVISFICKSEGVSFRHAVERLRSQAGVADVSAAAPARVKPRPVPSASPEEDAALLERVTDYYHERLKQTPEALAYLSGRGIDPAKVVDAFGLGFGDRSLCYVLTGTKMRSRLQGLGVLRESGHEHMNGSLVVPIRDEDGRVVNLYGRKIRDDLRKGTAYHLYLPGPHRGVFNLDGIRGCSEVILCEALIDALTVYAAGFTHVTSAYGAGGFTDEILQAFIRQGVKRVLIAYDRDAAGDKGAVKVAEGLVAQGIEAYRVKLPHGMDINAYALSVTDPTQALGDMFRAAEWMGGVAPVPGPEASVPVHPSLAAQTVSAAGCGQAVQAPVSPPLPVMPLPVMSLGASPVPAGPEALPALVEGAQGLSEISLTLGERHWRVRGLDRCTSPEGLKINLRVRCGDAFHVDGLELLSARARTAYVTEAAAELGVGAEVIKRDLGTILLRLEALQDERLRADRGGSVETAALTPEDEAAALAFLKSPDLLDRIAQDVAACGVVGEACNVQAVYLAALSRKLDKPLAVLIQSTSAAGKSALMDAVLNMVPEEERVSYSAMTGQSLFYIGEADLKHKALAIAEEEGVRQAAYALKLLQSQGSLTIASTGKDPASGKLVTQEYRVEGPVALMLTTTAIDLDEELKNRCLVLSVDESREQTRAIHQRQRFEETLEGLASREDEHSLIALHRNAQRLIKPVKVVNPYAEALTFRDDQTRTRRDHRKYLGLIRAIALLHQYQRPTKTLKRPDGSEVAYIEASLADIAAANTLAHAVLGTTLDELPPQTRRLLDLIRQMVTERAEREAVTAKDIRFSRRELRDYTGMGDTQAKVHLSRLVELEYVFVSRVRQTDQASAYVYELAWSGEGSGGQPFVMGLIDPAQLTDMDGYDPNRSGVAKDQAGTGRPAVGPVSAVGRGVGNPVKAMQDKASLEASDIPAQNAGLGTEDRPVAVVPRKPHLNRVALAG
ncbi:CHC2 zinc finger domain-containing protein [Asticcacaulis sp. W401b]|uniref:CHC2 zinc finger domain-containing protein n=1 Tax=Asticcacaulis sp. W401b TaxID=3388666 RepID=UPI003970CBFE